MDIYSRQVSTIPIAALQTPTAEKISGLEMGQAWSLVSGQQQCTDCCNKIESNILGLVELHCRGAGCCRDSLCHLMCCECAVSFPFDSWY